MQTTSPILQAVVPAARDGMAEASPIKRNSIRWVTCSAGKTSRAKTRYLLHRYRKFQKQINLRTKRKVIREFHALTYPALFAGSVHYAGWELFQSECFRRFQDR